jgi:RNA polymerase sigma-70 factor (ECF subfamily)
MSEPDDRDLMVRAQSGDRTAFDEIVRRHEPAVYAYARRCLGDQARAAEACQDAFVRAYTYRASFKPEAGSVKGWLMSVAANRVRDTLRARKNAPRPIEDASQIAATAEEGLAAFERLEVRDGVARALETLDDDHREVLALRYVSGLSYEEVARILGIGVSAAKMRAARARDILARKLAHFAQDTRRPK